MIPGKIKKNSSQKVIVIKEGSEEDIRLKAVLDIVLEADLKRLDILMKKGGCYENTEEKR